MMFLLPLFLGACGVAGVDAEGQLNVAYDLSGRNVMAQWNFAQTSAFGTKINYRAYVGESGMVSLGVSSRF